jgi:hypothetical protein
MRDSAGEILDVSSACIIMFTFLVAKLEQPEQALLHPLQAWYLEPALVSGGFRKKRNKQ